MPEAARAHERGTVPRAVVFAYHDVGVRCLQVLLAHGVDVPLVVSHEDDPAENAWFERVVDVAAFNGIPVITPENPNTAAVNDRVAACAPDFIFSFYYRQLLGAELLSQARAGAWNLHGSLLPRYRGRAPVNWAVLNGERETGASLHRMVAKADAGDLAGRRRVPVLPNDTALDVFHKVTWAAECLLDDLLSALLSGRLKATPLDLSQGNYCGRRRPEDGLIDWLRPAREIHNLVRAVAPPYPGAFFDYHGHRIMLLRSHYRAQPAAGTHAAPCLYWYDGACFADCIDGYRLRVLDLRIDGCPFDAARCQEMFGNSHLPCLALRQET